MQTKIQKTIEELGGILKKEQIKVSEPLSKHTSFCIGGACFALMEPKTQEELIKVLKLFYKNKVKFYIIGNGTNLLVKDKGVNAFIIKLAKNFEGITKEGNNVSVSAGTSLVKLNKYCMEEGLSGLEFSYGIPGTVGGAIFMNAGAYKGQMSDVVKSVTALYKTKIITLKNKKIKFSYRKSLFQTKKHYTILNVTFCLKEEETEVVKQTCNDIINKRKKNHSTGKSAGSVFKRNKHLIISKTLDQMGLKGYTVGGAQISEKHAGFIMNTGSATCEDVITLIKQIKKQIRKKYKVKIELEVKILGD